MSLHVHATKHVCAMQCVHAHSTWTWLCADTHVCNNTNVSISSLPMHMNHTRRHGHLVQLAMHACGDHVLMSCMPCPAPSHHRHVSVLSTIHITAACSSCPYTSLIHLRVYYRPGACTSTVPSQTDELVMCVRLSTLIALCRHSHRTRGMSIWVFFNVLMLMCLC